MVEKIIRAIGERVMTIDPQSYLLREGRLSPPLQRFLDFRLEFWECRPLQLGVILEYRSVNPSSCL